MFERFTERARQVIVLGKEEARKLGHRTFGTEHILLGLLREEEGLAAVTLGKVGVTFEETLRQVQDIRPSPGFPPYTDELPLTALGKKTLELALREALSLGHNYIGTEHILLGLIRAEPNYAMGSIARQMGFESAKNASEPLYQLTIEALGGQEQRRAEQPKAPSLDDITKAAFGTLDAFLAAASHEHRPAGRKEAAAKGFDALANAATLISSHLRGGQ